jgi:hypothetical protein
VEEDQQEKTIPNQPEEISWLLQLLADLESTPAPHTRFSSNEQLVELFDEVERKADGCMETLQQVCPDYFKRALAALDVLGQALSRTEVEPVLALSTPSN